MNKFGISIDWLILGADLALQSDKEQGVFFRGFIKELLRQCGSYLAAEKQLAWVNDKLSTEEKELLRMLCYSDEKDG